MEVTEVRIHLLRDSGKEGEKLRAFATVTFDRCFVVREVKVIEGDRGLFIAMPSRKAMERCRKCGARNVVQSNHCNQCGVRLPQRPAAEGRDKVYLDIAHPINAECRKLVHTAVVGAYEEELAREAAEGGRPASADETAYRDDFKVPSRSRSGRRPAAAVRARGVEETGTAAAAYDPAESVPGDDRADLSGDSAEVYGDGVGNLDTDEEADDGADGEFGDELGEDEEAEDDGHDDGDDSSSGRSGDAFDKGIFG